MHFFLKFCPNKYYYPNSECDILYGGWIITLILQMWWLSEFQLADEGEDDEARGGGEEEEEGGGQLFLWKDCEKSSLFLTVTAFTSDTILSTYIIPLILILVITASRQSTWLKVCSCVSYSTNNNQHELFFNAYKVVSLQLCSKTISPHDLLFNAISSIPTISYNQESAWLPFQHPQSAINNSQYDLLFNTHKVVHIARLGLHIKVKGTCVAGASSKVDHHNLIKADVQGGFVDKDETSFQWIQ